MRLRTSLCVGVALLLAAQANASLWENVWYGLDIAARPSGFPATVTGDGFRVNGARAGRVRVVPNGVVGKGYRVEFDRNFGVDSSGRAETLRLGGLGEITLDGGVQWTAGYMRPAKNFYAADGDLTVSNLNYDVRTLVGAQDARLTGTLNVAGDFNANILGFYEVNLNVSNANSLLTVDGVAAEDEIDSNFDIGPISLKGNLYLDAALGVLKGFGVEATDLETLFPRSPIDVLTEAIAGQRQADSAVAGDSLRNDLASLTLRTVLGQDGLAAQELVETIVANADALPQEGSQVAQQINAIPEAGTLWLLAVGGAAIGVRRRR